MSNSSSKGSALITGASRGIGAVCAHPVEALDYDFNLSKLERVMSGAGKVAALGHELDQPRLTRTPLRVGIPREGRNGRHRFDLVGFSLGAEVATFIAAEYAEMVRSLVLVSGFSYGGDPRMRLQFDLWLHLARTDKVALAKLLLVSGLSREFLSAFDENTIKGIIESFVAMSDWPLIEQNIRVDLAVDVREQAKKIKAPTLSITGEYDQIVPTFYTHELADLIPNAKRAEIPSGHLSFLEKPVDLASAMLTFLLEKHQNS